MNKIRLSLPNTVLFFTLLILSLPIYAQNAGSLDPTFGSGGISRLTFSESAQLSAIAVQTDKRIVGVGKAVLPGNSNPVCVIYRFTVFGALDTSFNGTGYTTVASCESLTKIAVQTDGKVVAAGMSSNRQFLVARANADGTLDANFGTNGSVITPLGSTSAYLEALKIQPDGKILAVGWKPGGSASEYDPALVRYNTNGSLDSGFGSGGIVISDLGGSETFADAVIQTDGKIVASGSFRDILTGQGKDPIVRYNPDGSIDTTFGSGGKVFIDNTSTVRMFLRPDGKILILEGSQKATRINTTGTVEMSYSISPVLRITSAEMQPDGKLVILGTTPTNIRVISRFNADGTTDTTFGSNGNVILSGYVPAAIAIAPDAKIVVGGTSSINTSGLDVRVTLARYLSQSARLLTPTDFDGDGRADLAVYRPTNGDWYISQSASNTFRGTPFGAPGDVIAPADYDGDGQFDTAVYRDGNWYRINSSTNSFAAANFGQAGDIPVPTDYDGDGKADLTVFRASSATWYRVNSSNNQFVAVSFGTTGDKPIIGDFDGDAKADLAVYRPSNGGWYRLNSSNNQFVGMAFGLATDLPVPADYDGDGKTDIAVYRDGNWYRVNSSDNSFVGAAFGAAGDRPVPADYDGDGKADVGVFRPSDGNWYLLRSTSGFYAQPFGANGDIPIPSAFIR